jgi:general secretion pathway protein I
LIQRFAHGRMAGFSLIEVIVALSILGFSIALVLESLGGASRAAARGERAVHAATLAQNLMARAGTRYAANVGSSHSGTEGPFHWSMQFVSALDIESGETLVRPVDVKIVVSWRQGRDRRHFEVTTTRAVVLNAGQ